MSSNRASPGISLGADNHGRLFQNSIRDRSKKTVKPSTLAAQYRLNVPATRTSSSPKVLRPSKHDMAQLVRDKMEHCGIVNAAEKEEHPVHEQKEVKLLDLDDSDYYEENEEEDELEAYFGACAKEKACQKYYREACSKMKIMQLSNFYKTVVTDETKVVGVTLNPKDIKACAIALSRDCEVEKIRFHSNNLKAVGAIYLSEVLAQNEYLVDVSITENNIGEKGAEAICRALKNNNYIRKLDLSGNNLSEDDAIYFKEMLDENHALRELHLRHNKFREKGGEIFAEGLAVNDFLKVLDLSWNHLRLRGATAIGRALQQNRHLETLDISWNGFHLTGAATISVALMKNTSLLNLDMSCNRLTDMCAKCLTNGLEQNSTLKVIRLGQNQMYPSSAQRLLECINDTPSAIQLLDLGDQCVYDTFVKLYGDMKKKRDPFKAIYGYVWDTKRQGISQSDITEDDKDLLDEDPLLVLFEYARLQNFRLLDMFQILDADNSGSLDKTEFKEGLEQVKIPMADRSLDYLIKKMDIDGDGEIDFGELMAAQRLHKEKLREFMRNDIPLEHTEIGRIDRKLRIVMSKRHLMKKKPTASKGRNLLKILTKQAISQSKTADDKNDPSKTEENKEPAKTLAENIKESMSSSKSGAPKLANLMGFLPDIKKKMSLVAEVGQTKETETDS